MNKVIIGLSGGVDSSVSALLLQEQGYEVIGIFLRNWSYSNKNCYWLEDSIDAMLVCQQLNITFHIYDMSVSYKKLVINNMFKEYSYGRTPNPDVLCNRDIKFNIFVKQAFYFKANFIATGHYAICKKINKSIYQLIEGVDKKKDQSYFLCQLNQFQLAKCKFPLGKYNKNQVRKKAEEAGLITSRKIDSQGLCFLGKIKLSDFLQYQLKCKLGEIIEISSNYPIYQSPITSVNEKEYFFLSIFRILRKYRFGKKIGIHYGAQFFTKGQRRGLRIGGTTKCLFVIDTDIENNIVYVGMGITHPGLYKKALFIRIENIHWIRKDFFFLERDKINIKCRIRYKQDLQTVNLNCVNKGIYINFENPQISITEGQFAVWYFKEEVIGSGLIS